MKKVYIFLLLLLIFDINIFPFKTKPVLLQEVFKTDIPPVIDGIINEKVWERSLSFTGFKTWQPDYNKAPHGKTVVFAAYDQENFYFAIKCTSENPSSIKATVTKRDNIFDDDWVGIVIDTVTKSCIVVVKVINDEE